MSQLWSSEELYFGSVVVSVWFCDEVLGCCSSLTIFSPFIKLPNLQLFLSSDVKTQKFCFGMVSFIFFFSFLFWAPHLHLKVDILLRRRNFILDSNNSILELCFSRVRNILCTQTWTIFLSTKKRSFFVSFI